MQTDNKSEIDQHITALLDNILAPTNDAELRGVLKTIEVLTDYVELENVRNTLESDVMFRENREIALIAFDIVRKMHSRMQSGGGADMSAIAVRVDEMPVQTLTESAELVAADIAVSVGAMEEPAAEPETVEVAVVDEPAITGGADEAPVQTPTESAEIVAAEEPAATPDEVADEIDMMGVVGGVGEVSEIGGVSEVDSSVPQEPVGAAAMGEPAIAVEVDETPVQPPTESAGLVAGDIAIDIGAMEEPAAEPEPVEVVTMEEPVIAVEMDDVPESPDGESPPDFKLGAPEISTVIEIPPAESESESEPEFGYEEPESTPAFPTLDVVDFSDSPEVVGAADANGMGDMAGMDEMGAMEDATDMGGMGDPGDMTDNPFEQSGGSEPEFSGLDEGGEFSDSPDQLDPADDRSQKAQEWKSTVEKIKELKKKYVSE